MQNIQRKPVQAIAATSLRPKNPTVAADPEPYVNASDAARFLGIHPKTLMRLARNRILPAYSFTDGTRHNWRFLKSELDIWMQTRVNSSSHPVRSVS